jgi:enoyl-CoA hydratase
MTEIRRDVTEGVATITLDAPRRRNALTPEMATELVAALDEADGDPEVGAIVLCGGASFCAGADRGLLREVGADPSEDVRFRAIETIYSAFVRVGETRVPTIAAVRGAAVGAGINLALAPDLRVVATDARLISGFTRIGIHPGGGHYVLVHRLAGREAAAAIGLFGEEIDGVRAAELGLAWRAVPDAEVEPVALALARRAARDPELSRRTVASFRRETAQGGLAWDVAVEVERPAQMWSFRRGGANPPEGGRK